LDVVTFAAHLIAIVKHSGRAFPFGPLLASVLLLLISLSHALLVSFLRSHTQLLRGLISRLIQAHWPKVFSLIAIGKIVPSQ
jgi:hypothetical protein